MLGRRLNLLAGLFGATLALAACNSSDAKPDPTGGKSTDSAGPKEWKVGAYLSLSGEDSAFGTDTREGIELAVDDINKAGGAKGKPIKVIYEDDKSKPDEATNKVLQLIDRDKVVALLGEVASGRSKPGGIVANRAHVPMITPSSTAVEITQIGPFIFRVCFTDDIQGRMDADFIADQLKKKRVGVLYVSDDPYSSGLEAEFEKEAKAKGLEIVEKKAFPKKETNFTTYINEIKGANPDVIYAPIYYNTMTLVARQAKAAGVPGSMFVGGDGWDAGELLRDAGEEMEGAYFTDHYAPDMPRENSKKFVAKYTERFHHEPSSIAAMGYDAAGVLGDAISRSKGDTPDAIRQAIQETKNFAGATGDITINAQRNSDKPIVVVQIRDKKFHYFSTVSAGGTAPAKAVDQPPPSATPSATPSAEPKK